MSKRRSLDERLKELKNKTTILEKQAERKKLDEEIKKLRGKK
jgi:hypothetical protein